jgi:methionyl-tRNA formyltransferase
MSSATHIPRIVFFGTPQSAVPALQALIKAGLPPVAVVTRQPKPVGRKAILQASPVEKAAREAGIPVSAPRTLKDGAFLDWFKAQRPDVAVLIVYGKILPDTVLAVPKKGFINVHPSLLPRHRGASPIVNTVLAGDTHSGSTIIKLDAEVDHGPILAQEKIAVDPRTTAGELTTTLANVGADLLVKTLQSYLSDSVTPLEQDHSAATFTTVLTREMGLIDWKKSAVEIDRQIRAYDPWPGTYTCWQGKRLKILTAHPSDQKQQTAPSATPGSVFVLEKNIYVRTSKGILQLDSLQLEGRKPQSAQDFLRGHPSINSAALEQC